LWLCSWFWYWQHKTIDSILARGERLDSLVEKSSDLRICSHVGIYFCYVLCCPKNSKPLWYVRGDISLTCMQMLCKQAKKTSSCCTIL
jgi:hypothetical protein